MPWKLPEDDESLLALAKGYPYEAPQRPYLYRDGKTAPLEPGRLAGRTPVIGHGSNRAPSQLHRKFGHLEGRASEIPVTLAWIQDYDIVYSAHVTRYGAIASTLHPAPGCRVGVAVTWLDPAQLDYMHKTEGSYSFGRLEGVAVHADKDAAVPLESLFVYRGDQGCLLSGGAPLGLAAALGERRPHALFSQEQALREVHQRYGPDENLERGILATIRNAGVRKAVLEAMARDAHHSPWPHFHPL